MTLNAQKQLPPVHPEANEPEDKQNRQPLQDWGVRRPEQSEKVTPQVNLETVSDETLKQMRHAIDGNGIHPHHSQRETPAAVTFKVHRAVEGRQQQAGPPGAEKHPRWRPDSFYRRTDAR